MQLLPCVTGKLILSNFLSINCPGRSPVPAPVLQSPLPSLKAAGRDTLVVGFQECITPSLCLLRKLTSS